jgi:hypothetical protein
MSTAPQWSAVDDSTADLLTLVATTDEAEQQWDEFLTALKFIASRNDGRVMPNQMRQMVRGVIAPQRIGAFTNRAARAGLIVADGWETSDDSLSGNAGKPARVWRLS